MKLTHQKFGPEEVIPIDNNRFEDCEFNGCRMVFTGLGGADFSRCGFNAVRWHFEGPAALTLSLLSQLTQMNADYGRDLIVSTFPALKEWLRPEILARYGLNTPPSSAPLPPTTTEKDRTIGPQNG